MISLLNFFRLVIIPTKLKFKRKHWKCFQEVVKLSTIAVENFHFMLVLWFWLLNIQRKFHAHQINKQRTCSKCKYPEYNVQFAICNFVVVNFVNFVIYSHALWKHALITAQVQTQTLWLLQSSPQSVCCICRNCGRVSKAHTASQEMIPFLIIY